MSLFIYGKKTAILIRKHRSKMSGQVSHVPDLSFRELLSNRSFGFRRSEVEFDIRIL